MQQLTLTLIGGLAQIPLWFATPKRHRHTKTRVFSPWRQFPLELPIRKLTRKGSHFIWTRPDGRQFVCRTMRSLIARVMDYDGHLLQGLLKSAQR